MDLILKLAALAIRPHYSCEDTWYNCPAHPEGSANFNVGTECNCGAEEHNREIMKIIEEIYHDN